MDTNSSTGLKWGVLSGGDYAGFYVVTRGKLVVIDPSNVRKLDLHGNDFVG